MPLAYDTLLNWPFEEIDEEYTEKDTMLYALGLGLGDEPTAAGQLRFVYEDGLSALPTMAVVLGYPGLYLRDPATGVDWKQMLHGEQGLVVHRPLAPSRWWTRGPVEARSCTRRGSSVMRRPVSRS
jgi:hypothetical protein